MALWKGPESEKEPVAPMKAPPPQAKAPPPKDERPAVASITPESSPVRTMPRGEAKESVIAAGLTIEGKIEGGGHVRIAGRFNGDVHVEGNLTIEPGAKLTGEVRAKTVVIGGELEGNIDAASNVELTESGVLTGDVKAGSLTVSAGSRMRGKVEFGWEGKGSATTTVRKSDPGPAS